MPAKLSKMRRNNLSHQQIIANKQVVKLKTTKAKSAKVKSNKKPK